MGSRLIKFWNALLALFGLRRKQSELDEEVNFHLEERASELLEQGYDAKIARELALREFGGIEKYKEEAREAWGSRFAINLAIDIRYSFKQYRKSRGYAVTIIATVAVCVSLNTSLFSLINSLRWNPRIYGQEDRIVRIFDEFQSVSSISRQRWGTSFAYYHERKEQSQLIKEIALQSIRTVNASYGSDFPRTEYAGMAQFDPAMFSVLKVYPALGRAFEESDAVRGNDNVVILTHKWWQTRFFGTDDILGKTIRADGRDYRVIGVMPESFSPPPQSENLQYSNFGMIVPFVIPKNPNPRQRLANYWGSYARLKPGVSITQLESELNAIAAQNGPLYPTQYEKEQKRGHRVRVWSLGQDLTRDVGTQLSILQVILLCILVLGGVNIASLVLSQNSKRHHEIGVRLAVGADRSRVAGQLAIEIWILCLVGGFIGLAIALFIVNRLGAWGVLDAFLVRPKVSFDAATLLIAFALCCSIALLSGLGSLVIVLGKLGLNKILKSGGRSGSEGRGYRSYRGAMIFAQIVAAFIVLVSGGLLLKSFSRILEIDPGFDVENVLTAVVRPPDRDFDAEAQRSIMFRLENELKRIPDVESVGITNWPPMKMNSAWEAHLIKEEESLDLEFPVCTMDAVNDTYFEALGLEALSGRLFNDSDYRNSAPVVVIDRIVADLHFPGENPVGKRIAAPLTRETVNSRSELDWLTVIGVVEPIRLNDLYQQPIGMIYRNYSEYPLFWVGLVIKTAGDPYAIVPEAERIVDRLARNVALGRAESLEDAIAKRYSDRQGLLYLSIGIGALALSLCILGIVGIVSYSVGAQVREIGTRIALGADRMGILWHAMNYWVKLSLAALVCGAIFALGFAPIVEGLLYQTSPFDSVSYLAVFIFLCLILSGAIFLSAKKVTRIQPIIALRSE